MECSVDSETANAMNALKRKDHVIISIGLGCFPSIPVGGILCRPKILRKDRVFPLGFLDQQPVSDFLYIKYGHGEDPMLSHA